MLTCLLLMLHFSLGDKYLTPYAFAVDTQLSILQRGAVKEAAVIKPEAFLNLFKSMKTNALSIQLRSLSKWHDYARCFHRQLSGVLQGAHHADTAYTQA